MDLRYRALLIGNSSFPADQKLARLDGPQNDILALRDALVHPELGMFDPDDVTVLAERNSHDVGGHLEGFFREAERDDVLLLYYSGHGKLDEFGKLLLCAQDTRLDRLITTTVASDRLNAMIDVSVATAIVIVLDCCHSGAFKSANTQDIVTPVVPSEGRGRYVMAACRPRELAADAMGPRHLSPFTHHVVAGLTGQVEKTSEDGFVSLDDLYLYVHSEMRTASRQTPVKKTTSEGAIRIARSARRRRPLSVAPKVINVVDVEPGEELPVERVRVRGLLPGDFWTATTEARWIQITRLDDVVELRLTAQPVKSRANVEIVNDDTGETRVVRVIVRPSSPHPVPTAPDPAGEKLQKGVRDLMKAAAATPPAARPPVVDFTTMDLDRLIGQVVDRAPGVRQAVLATSDGLLLAAKGPMGRDDLDRLAAGVAAIRSGGHYLAAVTGGPPGHMVAELDAGAVLLDPDGGVLSLALYTSADADIGHAAYEMAMVTHTLQGRLPPAPVALPDLGRESRPVENEQSWLLDGLMRGGAGGAVAGCVVASVDGIALASTTVFPFDAGHAAAVAGSLLGSCRGVAALINGGAVRTVAVETNPGHCLVLPFGDATMMVLFLTGEADLGVCAYEAMVLAARVADTFAGRAVPRARAGSGPVR